MSGVRKEGSRLVGRPITEQRQLFESSYIWDAAYGRRIKLPGKLSSLRQKLYRKAKQEPKFRFYTLYDRIYRPDVLGAAYRIARGNKGAPGVDGVSFEQIESGPGGVESFVAELHESLRTRSYKPDAVRGSYIAKPDGRRRPLGIPTIRDRVAQTATVLILEPIFEADFVDCSYGFRPNRSAHDALEAVRRHIKAGRTAIYDLDLKSYFDTIPHDKLMACLRMRITDSSVLRLIRMWLEAPVVEEDDDGKPKRRRRKRGTPQGGVISPLLANVYLHWFDKVFHFSSGPSRWAKAAMVRYADDLVVLSDRQNRRVSQFVEEKLESWMGLELNRNKTHMVNLDQVGSSLDFLGYTFRFDKDRFGRRRRYLRIAPSAQALAAQRASVRELTDKRHCFVPVPRLIQWVNRQLRGWSNYYCYGYPKHAYGAINWYVLGRLRRHLRRRSQRRFRLPQGVTYCAYLKRCGLELLPVHSPVCALR
jgi:RNA-directed DNA polymerase